MNITPRYVFSRQMNNWLNLRNLYLSQAEFDKVIRVYETRHERYMIEHVVVAGNYLTSYKELFRIFPNVKHIYDTIV